MSKDDAYHKFRAQYVDIVKSCEQGDKTTFAKRVRSFLSHEVEVAKLGSEVRKEYGRAWYNQDTGFSVFAGPIVVFNCGQPEIIQPVLECPSLNLLPQQTPMSREEKYNSAIPNNVEMETDKMVRYFCMLQSRADCLNRPIWCCPPNFITASVDLAVHHQRAVKLKLGLSLQIMLVPVSLPMWGLVEVNFVTRQIVIYCRECDKMQEWSIPIASIVAFVAKNLVENHIESD